MALNLLAIIHHVSPVAHNIAAEVPVPQSFVHTCNIPPSTLSFTLCLGYSLKCCACNIPPLMLSFTLCLGCSLRCRARNRSCTFEGRQLRPWSRTFGGAEFDFCWDAVWSASWPTRTSTMPRHLPGSQARSPPSNGRSAVSSRSKAWCSSTGPSSILF